MSLSVLNWVRLAVRRLTSRLALTLLSLLGVVLAVGLVASIPIFAQGVSFQMLREELARLGNESRREPFAVRIYYHPSEERPLTVAGAHEMESYMTRVLGDRLGLPFKQVVTQINSPSFSLRPMPGDLRFGGSDDVQIKSVEFAALPGVEKHIKIVDGEPLDQATPGDAMPVWVHDELCAEAGLNAGDTYSLLHMRSGQMLPIRIAGTWRALDAGDSYWASEPDTSLRYSFLIPEAVYVSTIEPMFAEHAYSIYWYTAIDERALAVERAGSYAQALQESLNVLNQHLPGMRVAVSPLKSLQRYLQRTTTLSVFLTAFSLPALGLLLYFFSSISTVTLLFQKEETAILASRGAGPGTIFSLATVETVLLVLIGTPLGLLLACGLARAMGYSLSFMAFVRRSALAVSPLAFDWRLLSVALLALFLARLLPALQAARGGVVVHLRERSRPIMRGGLLKIAVDLPLIVSSAYAYQQLSRRGTMWVINPDSATDPLHDPLLLLAPSLFILTASLVVVHLFPLLLRPIDALSGRLRQLAAYMGLRQLVRQSGQYSSALFLVTVCLSLGAFYASTALSLDHWLYDRILYQVGADLRITLGTGSAGSSDAGGPLGGEGWLLPVSDYLQIPGVRRATRVGYYEATVQAGNLRSVPRLLGVDRLDFPSVAFFRPDLASVSLGELMNRLGMHENGLLVSQRFMQANKLSEGQRLTLGVNAGSGAQSIDFLIVGRFDYFPTYFPAERELFVGNLGYLFGQMGGPCPHQVWMQTDPGADRGEILDRLERMGISIAALQDSEPLLIEDENRIERVGLFGVLSIGFLAGSLLSCVGLLVYTYASLQGRLQQFSILRAIGIGVTDVFAMVAVEYLGIVAYGVLSGAGVGIAASYLFVPFFQISSGLARAVPPFVPHIAWPQISWIAVAFGGALILSQAAILWGINRKDLSQTLRMGQRE